MNIHSTHSPDWQPPSNWERQFDKDEPDLSNPNNEHLIQAYTKPMAMKNRLGHLSMAASEFFFNAVIAATVIGLFFLFATYTQDGFGDMGEHAQQFWDGRELVHVQIQSQVE